MYDITDRGSFENVNNWVYQIAQYGDKHVNKILVGNKCDMEQDRAVSTEEGRALAEKHGMPFFECSAKARIKVDDAFLAIAQSVKDRLNAEHGGGSSKPSGGGAGSNNVDLGRGGGSGKKGGCC